MRKKTRNLVILSVLTILALFITSSCCPLFRPPDLKSDEETEAEEMGDEVIDSSSSDSEVSEDLTADDVVVEEPEVEEPPTFSVAATFNNQLFESTDAVLDLIFREPLPLARAKVVFKEELAGDNIFGDSSITPLGEDPAADIILSGHFTLQVPTDTDYPIMDFVVPCGMQSVWEEDPSVWVSCAGEGEVGDISTWHVFLGAMQDTIPRFDDTRFRTIAVVLDSDNMPENNFVPTFDRDFYQGSDLWYTWTSTPQEGWMPVVWGENFQEVPSLARILFHGNSFAVFIPGNEIPAKDAGFRIAVDSHLGMWDPNNYFGNVIGSDPTKALTKMDPENKLTLYIDKEGHENWLEGPYQPCLTRGCKQLPEYDYRSAEIPKEYWCECTGCTEDPDCGCYMFLQYRMPMWEISEEKITWSVAGLGLPGEKIENRRSTLFNCFCVKKLE
ncbi:MAG: hypothetical protein WBB69_11650 [Anaerolineales bacterium]